jgi:hypothetical protein
MVEENIQTSTATENGEDKETLQKEGVAEKKDVDLSNEEQESAESFSDPEIAALLERSFANVEEGRIVHGRIVQIHDSDALVDIGYKSEGTIPLREFKNANGEQLEVNVGDTVDVFLEDTEDENGLVFCRKKKPIGFRCGKILLKRMKKVALWKEKSAIVSRADSLSILVSKPSCLALRWICVQSAIWNR